MLTLDEYYNKIVSDVPADIKYITFFEKLSQLNDKLIIITST